MKNEMASLMKEIEADVLASTGAKLNWANVFNPNAKRTFDEWAALELIRTRFPVPQRVCAVTNNANC